MSDYTQREKAEQLRRMHDRSHEAPMLVLPNVWDAASARIVEQAGFSAVATTSSGVAAALGYPDGQRMSRKTMLDAVARIARVVTCPVTADFEAGYGATLARKVESVKAVIAAGAVGVNIEDSLPGQPGGLAETSAQADLVAALRDLGTTLGIPFVINARVDVFLRGAGEPERQFEQAVERANAYLDAGADCAYPIGRLSHETIGRLVQEIHGPINVMGGPPQPTLPALASLGVARVSLAGGLMRAALGHTRAIVRELRETGGYDMLASEALTSAELGALFPK
ncbi:MAG TPA: isocitrate lyase/phosphoenolpyruvate mutase family protein [Ktedonobacterales bacterium]|nr:isocitrate lyase/phosphoenolpyruvate mutase family protein [Ktedonobacterales bacterium]